MAATDQGSPVGRGEGFRGSAPVLTAPAQSSPSRLHTQEALWRVSARSSPPLQGAPGCSDQRLRCTFSLSAAKDRHTHTGTTP